MSNIFRRKQLGNTILIAVYGLADGYLVCVTTIYSGFAIIKYWVIPLYKPIMPYNILSEVLSECTAGIFKQN